LLEESIMATEVLNADEMFIAVSSKDIVPVVEFNSSTVGNGQPGKITKLLIAAFADIIKTNVSRVTD